MTSKLIMKTVDFEANKQEDASIYYNARCGCLADDHQQEICLKKDRDTGEITMEMYYNMMPGDFLYYDSAWPLKWRIKAKVDYFFTKIKNVIKFLFLGEMDSYATFYFSSREQIEDYIKALQEGIKKLEE